MLIGAGGIPIEVFLAKPIEFWFEPTGFMSLGFTIPGLERYTLRYKFEDDPAPEKKGVPVEPRKYLYISVNERGTDEAQEHFHYARSRTNFSKGGSSPTWEDEFEMIGRIRSRLATDLESRMSGQPESSREDPYFV